MIHTGKLLQTYFEHHRTRRAALSRMLQINLASLLKYEKNSTIQTRILWSLSHALQHNFFMDIAMMLPKEFSTNEIICSEKDERIKQLEEENKMLKIENNLLKEIVKK